MLLETFIDIGAKMYIIFKLKILNGCTSLRETYVTFHSNNVTFI